MGEWGRKDLTQEEIERFSELGYKVLEQKQEIDEEGRRIGSNCKHYIVFDGLKVDVCRWSGAYDFSIEYSETKHGRRIYQTWHRDKEKQDDAPNRMRTALTKRGVQEWLKHETYWFKKKVEAYESMLKLHKERMKECKAMKGSWISAHLGYWNEKRGIKSEPHKDDYFQVDLGWVKFRKSVNGYESLVFDEYSIGENKKKFFQSMRKKMTITYKLIYSILDDYDKSLFQHDEISSQKLEAVEKYRDELLEKLEAGQTMSWRIETMNEFKSGEFRFEGRHETSTRVKPKEEA